MKPGEFRSYQVIEPPFKLNMDAPPSALAPNEFVLLDGVFEHNRALVPLTQQAEPSFVPSNPSCFFALSTSLGNISLAFTDTKMYYKVGGINWTEVTTAGTTILSDSGNIENKFSITVINGILYFAHDGIGVLRKWTLGAATYSDVAAPATGWHSGNKFKPKYLLTHANRLLLGADTATGSFGVNDFAWSVSGQAENFDETGSGFGSGHVNLADSADVISGLSLIFDRLIIYKTDSIIIGSPTGDQAVPYNYLRYQQGVQTSVGNFAPYSLAGDGLADYFLSRSGFMKFDGATVAPIGIGVDTAFMSAFLDTTLSRAVVQGMLAVGMVSNTSAPLGTKAYCVAASRFSTNPTTTGIHPLMYNILTGGWSRLPLQATFTSSAGVEQSVAYAISGIGAIWPSNGTAISSFARSLAYGDYVNSKVWAITADSIQSVVTTMLDNTHTRARMSPIGPGYRRKTVFRLGTEFQIPVAAQNLPAAIQAVVRVFTETSVGSDSTQTLYPATNPSLPQSQFVWLDILATAYLPSIEFRWNLPTAQNLNFPRVNRFVIEYSLGDDR